MLMTIPTDIIVDIVKRTHIVEVQNSFFKGDSGNWSKFWYNNPNLSVTQKGCIVVKKLKVCVHVLYLN